MIRFRRRNKQSRPKRTVHLPWLIGTLFVVIALPATIAGLHMYQAPRLETFLKDRYETLSKEGKNAKAVGYLRLYVGHRPDDRDASMKLALLLADSDDPQDVFESQKMLLQRVRAGESNTTLKTAVLKIHLRCGERGDALRVARELESATDLTSESRRLIAEAYAIHDLKEEALRAGRAAVDADPRDLAALAFYLPRYFESVRDDDAFREEVDRCVVATGNDSMATLVAYVALRNAGVENIRTYLDRALEHGPDNVDVLLMASSEAMIRDPAEAEPHLMRAWHLAPQDERVQLIYGRWLVWAGRSQEASEVLRDGFHQKGRLEVEFARRLAEILIEGNANNEELSDCLRVVLADSDYQPAYRFLRGRAEMLHGNLDQAEEHLVIGQRLLEQGRMPSATATDREELAYKFELALAGIAYARGDSVKAIRLTEQAQSRLPREFTPFITLGQIHFELGNFEKSEQAWGEAVSRPFHPPGALLGLARTKLAIQVELPASQQNFDEVFALLEAARRRIPNDMNLAMLEADALWLAGRTSEAIDTLRATSQLHDRIPHPWLSLIRLLIADGQYETAQKEMARFDAHFGQQLASVVTRASLDVRAGDPREAFDLLASSKPLFPSQAEPTRLRLMGHVKWMCGDSVDAGPLLKSATELDPADDLAWAFYWTWLDESVGPEAADEAITAEWKRSGDQTVRWRWADSVRAVARNEAHPALAASVLVEHASVLDDKHRQHWATWHVKGLEAEISGRRDEAIRYYHRAVARGPALPSVSARLVRLLLQQRRMDDAAAVIAQTSRQRFPFRVDHLLTTEIALARQQHETVLAQVRSMQESGVKDADATLWMIAMLHAVGRGNEARKLLDESLVDHANDVGFWITRIFIAEPAENAKVLDETLEQIRTADLSIDKGFLAAELALAAGQVDRAEGLYREAYQSGKLTESQWRTVIDFLKWHHSSELETASELARQRFPSANWLGPPPQS